MLQHSKECSPEMVGSRKCFDHRSAQALCQHSKECSPDKLESHECFEYRREQGFLPFFAINATKCAAALRRLDAENSPRRALALVVTTQVRGGRSMSILALDLLADVGSSRFDYYRQI